MTCVRFFWRMRPFCCDSGVFKSAATFAFQDCEVEISDLKNAVSGKEAEVAAAEERCTHLVRLGEQRNQEIKTLQAQLVGVQASHVLGDDGLHFEI